MSEVLRYPGPAGEAVVRLLGAKNTAVALSRCERDHSRNAIMLVRAQSTVEIEASSEQFIGAAFGEVIRKQRVATTWAVADVVHVELSEEVNLYDCLLSGMRELNLPSAIEVYGVDPSEVKVGNLYAVVATTPQPTIVRGFQLYGQEWRLCDAER